MGNSSVFYSSFWGCLGFEGYLGGTLVMLSVSFTMFVRFLFELFCFIFVTTACLAVAASVSFA